VVLVLKVGTLDQRRIVLAALATLVALPFLLRETSHHATEAVAAVSPSGNLAGRIGSGSGSAGAGTSAATTTPGAATSAPGPVVPITIATPIPEGPNTLRGTASFTHIVPSPTPAIADQLCQSDKLPRNTKVTVLNTDNGHTAVCWIAGPAKLPPGEVLVLNSSVYDRLADMAQVPIPVRVSW